LSHEHPSPRSLDVHRRPASSSRRLANLEDQLALTRDVVGLIWHHKLWWLVPLILAMLVLSLVLVLEATPVGPLLYPLF
jgi:hypothetical protein